MSYLYVLSENELILFQDSQNIVNGISISNITATDVSVVRMTTELKVEYTLICLFIKVETKNTNKNY